MIVSRPRKRERRKLIMDPRRLRVRVGCVPDDEHGRALAREGCDILADAFFEWLQRQEAEEQGESRDAEQKA